MADKIVHVLNELLQSSFIAQSEQYTTVIEELLDNQIENKQVGSVIEDIIPDIDNIRYKNAVKGLPEIDENTFNSVRKELQDYLIENHHENFVDLAGDVSSRDIIECAIRTYCIENAVNLNSGNIDQTFMLLKKDILDYRILTDLIFDYDRPEDQRIEEIRVDDYNDIRIVVKGRVYRTDYSFDNPEEVFAIAQKLCRNGKGVMVKADRPFVRVRLGNNIRVSIMINPVARRRNNNIGPVVQIVIRKQRNKPFSNRFLINCGSINAYGDKLIETIIKAKISTAFYGGTNSGKTATMNSYVHRIDKDNRTISIAEIDEMDLRNIDVVSGKAINSALMWEIQPKFNVGYRQAVNYALTFSPETIILQEIKGEETVDAIDASITGHQIITTLHAANINVFGKRILGMYKQSGSDLSDELILEYVAEAFDLLISMKLYPDGIRRIREIAEITSYDRSNHTFVTNILMRYRVDDTKEYKEEYIKEEVVKKKILGRFEVVDFISQKLQDKMLENGLSLNNLNMLRDMYKEQRNLCSNDKGGERSK